MEIRLLRYFWTIAEEGTVSKAADILHITQPTLSRQLKELEAELGTTLFIRSKKSMQLTEAGLFLKSRANEILELTQETTRAFEDRKRELFSGRISVGCVEADNSNTLAVQLEDFVSDYPQITFNIFSGTSDDIKDKLEKGLLDLAVLLEPVDTEKYQKLSLPQTERWGLLISKADFLAQQGFVKPTDLVNTPLIMSRRPEVQQLLADWAEVDYTDFEIRGTFNLTFNVRPIVAHGMGAAVVIEGSVPAVSDGTTFLPFQPEMKTNCVLVWKKGRALSPAVSKFIEYFSNAYKA